MNSSNRVKMFFSLWSLLTLFSWSLQRDIRECIEAYVDKGTILRQKLERNSLINCFVIREFISQSYTNLLMEQFGSTIFGETEKGYFGSDWSLWWQREYPQIKTRKKHSGKVLFDVWIHLTELHHSFYGVVCWHYFCGICKGIFWSALKPMVTKEISSDKIQKEAYWETRMWCLNSSHRGLQSFSRVTFCYSVFGESENGYFESHWSLQWQWKHPQIKYIMLYSENLLCDVWNHLTELHHSFHGEVW